MFGAFDVDSLQFAARCLLRRVRTLTGESEDDAIRRALEERYLRLTTNHEQNDDEENSDSHQIKARD